MVEAAINQEVEVVSVVLYQALCPDSSLASLSAPAPRTWLSALPDPPDNMHHRQRRRGASVQSQVKKGGGGLLPLLIMAGCVLFVMSDL